jgi:hypothetical protein
VPVFIPEIAGCLGLGCSAGKFWTQLSLSLPRALPWRPDWAAIDGRSGRQYSGKIIRLCNVACTRRPVCNLMQFGTASEDAKV